MLPLRADACSPHRSERLIVDRWLDAIMPLALGCPRIVRPRLAAQSRSIARVRALAQPYSDLPCQHQRHDCQLRPSRNHVWGSLSSEQLKRCCYLGSPEGTPSVYAVDKILSGNFESIPQLAKRSID
jgi:hypothetical protein